VAAAPFVIDTHHHVGSLEALGLSIGTEGMAPADIPFGEPSLRHDRRLEP